MDNNNPYQTPQAEIANADAPAGTAELASRWARLGASILDTLIMLAISLPIMFLTGMFDQIMQGKQPGITYSLVMFVISLAAFALIHGKFLIDRGQTLGKMAVGIKIVDLDGNIPALQQYLKRYAVFFVPGQVPLVGQLFSIVNVLFIFGKQKRCIHDLAGGTRVIKA